MANAPLDADARTTLGRHSERGSHDRDDLYAVLDAGLVCHLGLVIDDQPLVLPTGFGRDGDTLYLHGSVAARNLRLAGEGVPVCVTVTLLDGLVLAESVFNHSMNYRSAVVFGRARRLDDPDARLAGLRTITEHLAPGQWDRVRQPNRKELAATTVLALPLTSASVKVRSGPPGADDDPAEGARPWTGVLPVRSQWGEPIADPAVPPGAELPAHLAALVGGAIGAG